MAYIEVARKNAKSTLASGIGLYMLLADDEPGAEIYSAATTRDQAKIVWTDAKAMVDKSPGLQKKFGVKTYVSNISVAGTNSIFKPLARDQGGNLDGLNIAGAVVDELHGHKTREMWDVIETGTGSRRQPLVVAITTAGSNRAGICFEQRDYATRILNGALSDEEYYGMIYTIDKEDDWTEEKNWIKANPNWNVSVKPDDIRRKARKAMASSAAVNNFLTKHLDQWVNADESWMDLRNWEACKKLEEGNYLQKIQLKDSTVVSELWLPSAMKAFKGEPCHVSVDLSTKKDVAPVNITFKKGDIFYGFNVFFLPKAAVVESTNASYEGWEIDGCLNVTAGNVTDFNAIERLVLWLSETYVINSFAYDPWQAQYLANRLDEKSIPVVEYRQITSTMSEPMKEFDALVLDEKFFHTGDPVMTWMISNVVCHYDNKDNVYPNKSFRENKIDGVVAQIMSIGRWMESEENEVDPYLDRGFITL